MRMPGKESKAKNYPPCNRAFALRMMNPMSYQHSTVSPLDGEIQPVIKKPIAKNISEDSNKSYRDSSSLGDGSISPASSLASFQDMELYDIDEDEYLNGGMPQYYANMRMNSSFDSASRPRNGSKSSLSGKPNSNGFISRSYSSSDGFTSGYRNSPRSSSGRARGSSSSPRTGFNATVPQEVNRNKANSLRSDVANYLQNNAKISTNGSSLKRSQSLRDRIRPNIALKKDNNEASTTTKRNNTDKSSPGSGERWNSPVKLRVASTRSSMLRAKHLNQTSSNNNNDKTQSRIDSGFKGKKQARTTKSSVSRIEDESDSSMIYSEMDAYHPRNNPRVKKTNPKQERERKDSTLSEASSLDSYDSALQMSSPSTPSAKPNILSSPANLSLPSSDKFSSKLADICHLISERYPGDFQILETLTEMQAAYEERNEVVSSTLARLRRKIKSLEAKISNGPNIPGLVIPLMRATTNFQNQLQSIVDAHQQERNYTDQSTQVSEITSTHELTREHALEEISSQANQVIAELEKVNQSHEQSTSNNEKNVSMTIADMVIEPVQV